MTNWKTYLKSFYLCIRLLIDEILLKFFKEVKYRAAYRNRSKSDGEKSTREVAAVLKNKCSHSTIARLWNKWALLGLVAPAKQKGRYKAAFNLEEYGISGVVEEEEKN